jgi:hypothetical protein
MIRPAFDDEKDKPLDPEVEKVRRKLVRFVAINLGLLLFALMAVVGAIVYKARNAAAPGLAVQASDIPIPAGSVLEADIPLPAGAKIMSQSLSGNRIALDIELPGGVRAIHVYDIAERRIIGRFAVTAK